MNFAHVYIVHAYAYLCDLYGSIYVVRALGIHSIINSIEIEYFDLKRFYTTIGNFQFSDRNL